MHLIRVNDHELAREFVELPHRLHRQARRFSRAQQKHILALIKRKDPFFDHEGDAEFWILTNFRGETIGRIAAFVFNNSSKGYIGLFDCINHLKAASLLFDQCKTWLQKFEIKTMEGPFSTLPFQLEGLALDNKLQQSVPFVNIQSLFFTDLFEFYGFKNYQTQQLLSFEGGEKILTEREVNNFTDNAEYEVLKVDKNNINRAAKAIAEVYSATTDQKANLIAEHDLLPWLRALFNQHFPPLIWVVYHRNEAIAFFINVIVDTPQEITSAEKITIWQQIAARFTPQHKSLLNLGLSVVPNYEDQEIEKGLLKLLEDTINKNIPYKFDQFFIIDKYLNKIRSVLNDGVIIDKFVKFKYKFDQEPLIGTFAKSKIISPE